MKTETRLVTHLHPMTPWRVAQTNPADVLDSGGRAIANCITEAVARRIVACVNACESTSSHMLENGYLRI